mmetsp:Transcript_5617/g.21723  ORF Transcript_5617/g.21723 Transcript_5617/m.21723 type:complete len:462 (+) Transcript_5617:243-1628(+)
MVTAEAVASMDQRNLALAGKEEGLEMCCEAAGVDIAMEEGQDDYFQAAAEKSDAEKLPLGAAAVILAICFSEGVSATILNPFCGLMVEEEFGIPSTSVGYWVGLLTASFFLGQLLSSFPIGIAADKIGRRPVLLTGILGNIITLTMFGLSKWMWWAMWWRFVSGVTNGNTAVVKTYIRDISTDATQAKLYSLRSSMRATGFLVGPIIGGFLSRPSETLPFSIPFQFTDNMPGLFILFPYLLPCICAAALNIGMLVAGCLFLNETLVKESDGDRDGHSIEEEEEGWTEMDTLVTPEKNVETVFVSKYAAPRPRWTAAFSKNVIITIALYGLLSLVWVGFQETFPVWAIRAPEEYGLGFDESKLGLVNGLCASGTILFQVLLYAPLDHRVGTLQLFRRILVLWAPFFVVLPFCQYLTDTPVFLWVALISILFLLNALGTALMAGVNIMVCVAPPTVSSPASCH